MDVGAEPGPPGGGRQRRPPTAPTRRRTCPSASATRRTWPSYERIFANVDYWKRIGEEFQNPLIVTGTVLFTPHQRSGFVTREQEVYDSFGRRRVVPVRTYMERKGFILRPKFIFIDGRTGTTLYARVVPRGDPLQRAAEHAGAVLVLRADGPPGAELPEHAQHAEDQGHPRPAEVAGGPRRRRAATAEACRPAVRPAWAGDSRPGLHVQRLLMVSLWAPVRGVAGLSAGAQEDTVFAIIQSGGRQVKVTPGAGRHRRPLRGATRRAGHHRPGAARRQGRRRVRGRRALRRRAPGSSASSTASPGATRSASSRRSAASSTAGPRGTAAPTRACR